MCLNQLGADQPFGWRVGAETRDSSQKINQTKDKAMINSGGGWEPMKKGEM